MRQPGRQQRRLACRHLRLRRPQLTQSKQLVDHHLTLRRRRVRQLEKQRLVSRQRRQLRRPRQRVALQPMLRRQLAKLQGKPHHQRKSQRREDRRFHDAVRRVEKMHVACISALFAAKASIARRRLRGPRRSSWRRRKVMGVHLGVLCGKGQCGPGDDRWRHAAVGGVAEWARGVHLGAIGGKSQNGCGDDRRCHAAVHGIAKRARCVHLGVVGVTRPAPTWR